MRFILPFLAVACCSGAGWAISPIIDNLDSRPHHVQVQPIGGENYTVTVPAGSRRELYDHEPSILNLDDPQASPIRTDDDEEYVFWRDGRLLLQKYNFRQRRGY